MEILSEDDLRRLGCTDPARWKIRPDANASDEEISSYLDHMNKCPFDMSFQQADDEEVSKEVRRLFSDLPPDTIH